MRCSKKYFKVFSKFLKKHVNGQFPGRVMEADSHESLFSLTAKGTQNVQNHRCSGCIPVRCFRFRCCSIRFGFGFGPYGFGSDGIGFGRSFGS
jgi:hypothetical protein